MRRSKRLGRPPPDTQVGPSEPNPTLEILVDETVGELILKPHAAAFLAAHPHLSLGVRQHAFAPDAPCKDVDLVLQYAPASAAPPAVSMLGAQRLLTCASPQYLRARGVPSMPSDLRTQRHDAVIVSETAIPSPAWQFANLDHALRIEPQRCVTTPSLSSALALTLEGAGIARLPERWSIDQIRSGHLVRLLPEWEPSLHLLAYAPRGRRSPEADAFLRFVRTLLDTGAAPVLQRARIG